MTKQQNHLPNRSVSVRVVDAGGKAVCCAKVSLRVAGQLGIVVGALPSQQTNCEGIAEFRDDLGQYAKIAVYVDDAEKVRPAPLRSEYMVTA